MCTHKTSLIVLLTAGMFVLAGCGVRETAGELTEASDERTDYEIPRSMPSVAFSRYSMETLIDALDDDDAYVRYFAVQSLGLTGNSSAVAALIALLNDKDVLIRSCTAASLGLLGDKRAVEPLIGSLHDSEYSVRIEAARALDRLGWEPARERDAEAYRIIKGEEKEKARIDSTTIEPLVSALTDSNCYIRVKAARMLDQYNWVPKNEEQRICYIIARGEPIAPEERAMYGLNALPKESRVARAGRSAEREREESPSDAQQQYALETGRLTIKVKPRVPVVISIDGKEYTETAGTTIDMPVGMHTVEAIDPDYRYYAAPKNIAIEKNRSKKLTFKLTDLFPPISNIIIHDLAEECFEDQDIHHFVIEDVWRLSKTKCLASFKFYKGLGVGREVVYRGSEGSDTIFEVEGVNPILFLSLEGFTIEDRKWEVRGVFNLEAGEE